MKRQPSNLYPLLWPAAVLAAASMAGCRPGAAGTDGQIDNFEVEQTVKTLTRCYRLTQPDDTLYLSASVSVQWPRRLGGCDIEPLRRHLVAVAFGSGYGDDVDKAMTGFVDSAACGLDDIWIVESVDPALAPPAEDGGYIMKVTAVVSELTPLTVTYEVKSESYMGGAHPNASAEPFTYMLDLGRVLDAATLLKPGSDEAWSEALNRAAAWRYGVRPYHLADAGFFSDTLPVTGSLYLSDGSVVMHFNPYDVAPYSMGAVDVELSPLELEGLTSGTGAGLLR